MTCLLARGGPPGRLDTCIAARFRPSDRRPAKPYSSILAAIGSAFFLLACGAQGPPLPPRVEQPERVKDLAVVQVGRTLELGFTPPLEATDGERLSKPLEVQVFRAITPPGQKPINLPVPSDPWVTLGADNLPRSALGKKIDYPTRLSEQEFSQSVGSTFTFAVRALTRGFRRRPVEGELSKVVGITLLDVSGPVQDLEIKSTEKSLELRWTVPVQSLGNRPLSNLSGYRVYRSKTGKPDSFQSLGETDSASYSDPDFAFDRTYFYKVRAAFKQNSYAAESEDSRVVEIAPHDTFPPAVPTGLTAVYSTQVVELIWTANTEPDLAGYNVYRREKDSSPQRLNQDLLRTPIFHDVSAEPGHEYFYHVTAVDLANNESPPSPEVTVETL